METPISQEPTTLCMRSSCRNREKSNARKIPGSAKAAGAALAAKRGEIKKSELFGASKEMYESMTEKELEEFAETKRKGLPQHVDDRKKH